MGWWALVRFHGVSRMQIKVGDKSIELLPVGSAVAALKLSPRAARVMFHGCGGRNVFTFTAWTNKSHAADVFC